MTGFLPQIAAYYPSLLALEVLCLAVLAQSLLAGAIGLGKGYEVPGMPLKGSHADFSFRTLRTYGNSVETFAVFFATVLLAIVVGASAPVVNWLTGIHVALRLVYWAVYYSGIGKVAAGPRTIVYVLAYLANAALAIVVLIAMVR